jgi:hypothetical protein
MLYIIKWIPFQGVSLINVFAFIRHQIYLFRIIQFILLIIIPIQNK